MDKDRLNELIAAPGSISPHDIEGLTAMAAQYPWFGSAHLLLAIGEEQQNALLAPEQLALAAANIPDRSLLFDHIHGAQDVAQGPSQPTPIPKPVDDPLDRLVLEEAIRSTIALSSLEGPSPVSQSADASPSVASASSTVGPSRIDLAGPTTIPRPVRRSFLSWLEEPDHAIDEGPSEQGDGASIEQAPGILIDKFIQSSVSTGRKTEFFSPVEMGKRSLDEQLDLVTETLARVYEQQGNFKKAMDTYERLALKYPHKSAYFAGLVKALEAKQRDLNN